jgi:triphosphatase
VSTKFEGEQQELELKLEFDAGDGALLEHCLSKLQSQPDIQPLISTYYDTEAHALRDAGVALRIREQADRFVQTVKAGEGNGALFDRSEWENDVPGHAIDLDAVRRTRLSIFEDKNVLGALRPLFETRVDRRLYAVSGEHSDIELAVDCGEVATARRHSPIMELELELKRGEKIELFRLARALADVVPLRLSVQSKSERGYALLDGAAYEEKARPVQVPADASCGEAFQIIARNCVRQVLANEAGMCKGRAEALHQMRVGLRRLRAAIALFDTIVEDGERPRIKAELKWVTNELGLARDLDVLGAEVFQPLQKVYGADANVAAAQRHFEDRRADAYSAAKAAIKSDRFRNVMLEVTEWVEVGSWTQNADALQLGIEDYAAHRLREVRKKIKRKGKHLKSVSDAKRHKLRILVKRMRYAVEFFAATFATEKQAKLHADMLDALKDLQGALGSLNDIVQRDKLIEDAAEDGLDAALVSHLHEDKGARAKHLKLAEEAYEKFAELKRFWKR